MRGASQARDAMPDRAFQGSGPSAQDRVVPQEGRAVGRGAHGSNNLKATFQWNEHRPLRSQARRVHPGQAQSSVPAWQRISVRCSGQVRPREAGR